MSWKAGFAKAVKEARDAPGKPPSAKTKFTISVAGVDRRVHVLRHQFKRSDDVASLRTAIKDEVVADADIVIFCLGTVMLDGKTLESYGIDSKFTVNIARKLRGGAMAEPDYDTPHLYDDSRKELRTTSAPDSLMGIDDSDNPRVLAPCGKHGFCAETYYQLLRMMLREDAHSHELFCPMPDCGVEVPFSFVAKAASLTEEERDYFSMHIGMRAMKTSSVVCPSCARSCTRPERLDYVRVACVCSGGDFCFQCGSLWKGGGFQVCGNTACPTYGIQKAVSSCEMVTLTGGHSCPKLRACPKCMALISWTSACKHFRCARCEFYFCYLCLKEATKECKAPSYSLFCEIAPRQTLK